MRVERSSFAFASDPDTNFEGLGAGPTHHIGDIDILNATAPNTGQDILGSIGAALFLNLDGIAAIGINRGRTDYQHRKGRKVYGNNFGIDFAVVINGVIFG